MVLGQLYDDNEIARRLERSVGSIRVRRCLLRKAALESGPRFSFRLGSTTITIG